MSRGRSDITEPMPMRAVGATRRGLIGDVLMASWRDRLAATLLAVAALGALASWAGALSAVAAAGPDTQIVEAWRMLGFLVFAGLFALLAVRPRLVPGVWEVVILHKAGMAIFAATLIGRGVAGAGTIALVDGVLALMIVAAYVLACARARVQQLDQSTLLNMIGCLDKPSSGAVIIDGVDTSRLHGNKLAGLRAQAMAMSASDSRRHR